MHRPLPYRFQYQKKIWGDLKNVWRKKMFSAKSMTKLEALTVLNISLQNLGYKSWRQPLFLQGCQSSDPLLTMFIILPSSNECKVYLTLAPFTVVSAYIQLTNPFAVVQDLTSFKPIIQDSIHSCYLSTSRSHSTICRLDLS